MAADLGQEAAKAYTSRNSAPLRREVKYVKGKRVVTTVTQEMSTMEDGATQTQSKKSKISNDLLINRFKTDFEECLLNFNLEEESFVTEVTLSEFLAALGFINLQSKADIDCI